jgi:type VI secretion system protein ImpB
VNLKFESLRDFEPDALVEQVPELKRMIELRDALKALKGPLGNLPEFRKRLAELITDEGARQRLLAELDAQNKE